MMSLTEEILIFEKVEKAIAENARKMIYDLNEKWKILGVDNNTRRIRSENLVAFVQERYDELVEETDAKVKKVNAEIQALQGELSELSLNLNMTTNFTIPNDSNLEIKRHFYETELIKFRSIFQKRVEKIRYLNECEEKLSRLLGIERNVLSECPLASEDVVHEFEQYLSGQEKLHRKRLETFRQRQTTIRNLMRELEQEAQDSFQRSIMESSGNDFILSDTNLAHLLVLNDSLKDQLEQRELEIMELKERLALLWERLEEPHAYRDKFLEKNSGHSKATEAAIRVELERCEKKKRECFQMFIAKIRSEVLEMWDKCHYSEIQRDRFVDYYQEHYDEDLLVSHEVYLKDLNKFYEDNKHIFELYATRQNLWIKWKELEEKSKDSGRFQNRGGQLLREEKERKAVSNQLPKIEAELEKMAQEYESNTGREFTIQGNSLIRSMQEDWMKKNEERQIKLSTRKNKSVLTSKTFTPCSAPPVRNLQSYLNRETLTAVKRRLSPHSSRSKKGPISSRRLQFNNNEPALSPAINQQKIKVVTPSITINGYIQRKRKIGRLSQESKAKRRHRKSSSSSKSNRSSKENLDLTSYTSFQEHINDNEAIRSSIIPGHNLRPRVLKIGANKFKPDGKIAEVDKENSSPNPCYNVTKTKTMLAPFSTPDNKFAFKNKCLNTPVRDLKKDIDVFATPARPVQKSMHRQNTILVASPSITNTRPLRRSNSSHNLRSNVSYTPSKCQKLHMKTNLPLII